jgi:glutamate dehydrogenase (NAD(P)+)
VENLFRFADELGPAKILHVHDPGSGLKGIAVVDNVACGPAIGGIRLAPDVSVEECVRLARAMTLKNAAAGLAHGGGKSVIVGDPHMPSAAKERLIRAFACGIAGLTDYIPGPDMGTDEQCMGWVKDEIGRAIGLPRAVGGIPLDEIGATGLGCAVAAEAAEPYSGVPLKGARVAIQGFGAVGKHAARFLAAKGAKIIAVSDSGATLCSTGDLDVAALVAHKQAGHALRDFSGGEIRPADAVLDVACEIWIPAARPDVLSADTVGRLKTRLVVQGANIPATPEAEAALAKRGVLSIPDFIANAGGVICGAVEYHGGSEAAALAMIRDKIAHNVAEVLAEAKTSGLLPRAAAEVIARRRVAAAQSTRRRF